MSSSKETLVKYQNLFEKYFLKSLTSRLSDYTSEKFEVINSDKKNAKYTIVNSRIAESKDNHEIKMMNDLNKVEIYIFSSLIFLTIFFGVYPKPLINTIDVSVQNLINNYEININYHSIKEKD